MKPNLANGVFPIRSHIFKFLQDLILYPCMIHAPEGYEQENKTTRHSKLRTEQD